ncbi:MAG: Ig-like domain-containing protein [Saprospiraceae bacterium]
MNNFSPSRLLCLLPLFLLSACIGDDFVDDRVDPELRLTARVDTIGFGESFQFTTAYLNNIGQQEDVPVQWSSSDETVIAVDQTGLATGLQTGAADLTAEVMPAGEPAVSVTHRVAVGDETVTGPAGRTGSIATTSSYLLQGAFEIEASGSDLVIDFADNFSADTRLPGLYVYLTNNPNTTNGALEIGPVTIFSGAHQITVPDVDLATYSYILYFCKPFNVKVGDGEIQE